MKQKDLSLFVCEDCGLRPEGKQSAGWCYLDFASIAIASFGFRQGLFLARLYLQRRLLAPWSTDLHVLFFRARVVSLLVQLWCSRASRNGCSSDHTMRSQHSHALWLIKRSVTERVIERQNRWPYGFSATQISAHSAAISLSPAAPLSNAYTCSTVLIRA